MPTKQQIGFAGQTAVMTEFSILGYITSIPGVDMGDDIFVVSHPTSKLYRIQVKTSQGTPQSNGSIYYQFNVKEAAIHNPTGKADHFIFCCRLPQGWNFYIFDRGALSAYVKNSGIGSVSGANRVFTFIYTPGVGGSAPTTTVSGQPVNAHLNDWTAWPVI